MHGLSSRTSRFIRMDLRTGLKLRKQVCEVRRMLLSRRRRTFPQLSCSDSNWLGRTMWRAEVADLLRLTTISVPEVKIEDSPEKKIMRSRNITTHLRSNIFFIAMTGLIKRPGDCFVILDLIWSSVIWYQLHLKCGTEWILDGTVWYSLYLHLPDITATYCCRERTCYLDNIATIRFSPPAALSGRPPKLRQ